MQESITQKLWKAQQEALIKILDDQRKIEYVGIGRAERFTGPEEQVRALYYIDLITKYEYPTSRIEFETEMPSRVPRYYADIVVYEDDEKKLPYIVIECKKDGISDAEFEQATKQAIGNARVLGATYAVCVAGNTKRVIETKKWNDKTPDEATIADIPVAYGKIEEWRYRKGDPDWELKTVERQELVRALEKSHNTLWAGGKRNPTVAFDELCKIIFVKIKDEQQHRRVGDPYEFQIKTHEKTASVYTRIESIYQEAKIRDPEVFTDDIKASENEIYTVVGHLQGLSLSGTDLDTKGVAFEKFMDDFFKGKSGQFFTPRAVVRFAVKMMGVTNKDLVLDPACGSAGFLLYAFDAIREQAAEIYGDNPQGQDYVDYKRYWHEFASKNLYGIEINDSLARVAKMNMIIHDDGHTNVICHDGLASINSMHSKNPGFSKDHFDFILTNPPFGAAVKKSEHQYMSDYVLGYNGDKVRDTQKTEILFIERCINFLKPGTGRMAIVLPDSILTNSSLQYVRDYIMDSCQVLAIVSLPSFAFAHYGAGVKSSIVFVRRKGKSEPVGEYSIFMAQAEHIGYDATGYEDKKNDLEEIAAAYAKHAA